MADVVAVLVVPAENDPGGLLTLGTAWACPPCVRNVGGLGWTERPPYRDPVVEGPALPLWWNGELIPEGWDRARRVLSRFLPEGPGQELIRIFSAEQRVCWWATLELRNAGLARRVVRLARGEAGQLVEVTGG